MIAQRNSITANTTFVLEPVGNELIPGLLPFIMQTEAFTEHSIKQSKGSVNPYINFKDIAWFEFDLPPNDEQRQIAEILWAADDMEQKWTSALEKLEVLKHSISHDYFSTESEGQRVVKCEDLGEITVGIVVTPAKFYVADGVPTLRSLNVFPDRFDLSELVHISQEAHQQHSKSKLAAGTVVVVRTGRPGDAAVIPPEIHGYNCIDLIIVRPSDQVMPAFLSRFLNSNEGRKQITRGTAGTAQQHFNIGQIKQVAVPVPELAEQQEIVEKLDHLESQLKAIQKNLDHVRNVKKGLIAQVLRHV